MALSAAQVTLNAAVDTFIAALVTYFDTLSAGDRVHIVFPKRDGEEHAATGPDYKPASGVDVIYFNDTTDLYPFFANGTPLVWKITNGAGDIAGA